MTKRTLGLIVAPGALGETTELFKESIPGTLSDEVSDKYEWEVEIITDPLTGLAESEKEIYDKTIEIFKTHRWDYCVTITDLPIYEEKKIIAIDINRTAQAAIISTPSYGWPPVRKKVLRSIISIMKIMNGSYSESEEKGVFNKLFPTSRLKYSEESKADSDNERALYYLKNNIRGTLRLIGGMSWANNPFNMMRSLSGVIAIAFATGSFGLIFSTMWNLSYYFPLWRLALISVFAVIGMVIWIIVSHSLWETKKEGRKRGIIRIYNSTTLLTLLISLTFYYTVLYLMFLSAAVILLPSSYVETAIGVENIGPRFYFELAWFAASLSTVAGAIGAGIEDRDLIRESTYGYRQRFRYERTLDD